MIPYLVIIVFAVLGFLVKGVGGLIVGGIVGYSLSFIIGASLLKKSKGLVPYTERQKIAQDMINKDRKTVEDYSQKKDINAVVDFVATDIEQLFRESFSKNKAPKNYWMSYPVIESMIISRVDQSSGMERKYNELLRSSIKLMYPALRNQESSY